MNKYLVNENGKLLPLTSIVIVAVLVAVGCRIAGLSDEHRFLLVGWTLIVAQFVMLWKSIRVDRRFQKLDHQEKHALAENLPDQFGLGGPNIFSKWFAYGYHLWAPIIVIPTLNGFWMI